MSVNLRNNKSCLPKIPSSYTRNSIRPRAGFDAGGQRHTDRQRGRQSIIIEFEQTPAGGDGTEGAEGRGRMPALGVVVHVHAAGHAGLGLEPGDISFDEIAPGHINLLAERQGRRYDGGGRMPAEGIVAIIEIECVRRGAVDQGRIERIGAACAAPNQTGPRWLS